MGEQYLIEKRGLYYRPEAAGYTGLKSEAGLYSLEQAAAHAGPGVPDAPINGLTIWLASEAPEYAPACAWDVKMRDQAYRQGYADALASMKRTETMMLNCPQCGCETPEDQFQEGYCIPCFTENQRVLDEHNAQYDHWYGLSDEQRAHAIRQAIYRRK